MRLKELRDEFINNIEKVAKNKLTLDNMIMFNKPVYISASTYWDSLIISDNGQEIFLTNEDEDVCDLVTLTIDILAEIADIIEDGNYKIEE